MEVALFNVKITIQKNEPTVDAVGNHVNEWTDYFSCFATISGEDSAKTTEGEAAGTTTDHAGMSFTVRYCQKTIAVNGTGFRVIFGDDIYNILSVDHMNYKRKALKLRCEKVRR